MGNTKRVGCEDENKTAEYGIAARYFSHAPANYRTRNYLRNLLPRAGWNSKCVHVFLFIPNILFF